MTDPTHDQLRDLLAKKEAECRALEHQFMDMTNLLREHNAFVRLCGAIFPALEGIRPAHALLMEKAKASPLP